ncbi:MAG: hypothetical protein DWQ29_01205, partial [Planctomycetota bacterium]
PEEWRPLSMKKEVQTDDLFFGNFERGSIHGIKFIDANGNGVADDGEALQAGVTFTLTGTDGMGNPVGPIVVETDDLASTPDVDETGQLWFNDLKPGTYTVTETVPPGFTSTTHEGNPPAVTLTVTSGVEFVAIAGQAMLPEELPGLSMKKEVQTDELIFGNVSDGDDFQIRILGLVFNDIDGDGIPTGEPGLSGWEIRAFEDANDNGILEQAEIDAGTVAMTTTAANGTYLIEFTPENDDQNSLIVTQVLQPGWTQTDVQNPAESTVTGRLFPDKEIASRGYALTNLPQPGMPGADEIVNVNFGNMMSRTTKRSFLASTGRSAAATMTTALEVAPLVPSSNASTTSAPPPVEVPRSVPQVALSAELPIAPLIVEMNSAPAPIAQGAVAPNNQDEGSTANAPPVTSPVVLAASEVPATDLPAVTTPEPISLPQPSEAAAESVADPVAATPRVAPLSLETETQDVGLSFSRDANPPLEPPSPMIAAAESLLALPRRTTISALNQAVAEYRALRQECSSEAEVASASQEERVQPQEVQTSAAVVDPPATVASTPTLSLPMETIDTVTEAGAALPLTTTVIVAPARLESAVAAPKEDPESTTSDPDAAHNPRPTRRHFMTSALTAGRQAADHRATSRVASGALSASQQHDSRFDDQAETELPAEVIDDVLADILGNGSDLEAEALTAIATDRTDAEEADDLRTSVEDAVGQAEDAIFSGGSIL